jgi:hypothetical protein
MGRLAFPRLALEIAAMKTQKRLTPGKTVRVTIADGSLYLDRDSSPTLLIPEAGHIFFRQGVEGRSVFRRAADGKVDAYISRRNNGDVVWLKTK